MTTNNEELAITQGQSFDNLSTVLSIFDSGAFERLYRVASALADSSLVPASLRGETKEQTAANCLRVVEQSARWGLSPFAVCDCASVVHGRLMWEGKLVAAVIDAKLGLRLSYAYEGSGDAKKVTVSGQFSNEPTPRTIEGTVSAWKTHGKGSPWENPNNHERQLAYRGAREWARRHAPSVMLGVYTPDEFEEDEIRDVTPRKNAILRDKEVDPAEEIKPEQAAAEPTKAEAKPKPKKERLERTGTLEKVEEKQTKEGKPFWIATFAIGGKTPELTTFSTTLGEALMVMEYGAAASLTIVPGSKPGLFTLEDFADIDSSEEEWSLL